MAAVAPSRAMNWRRLMCSPLEHALSQYLKASTSNSGHAKNLIAPGMRTDVRPEPLEERSKRLAHPIEKQ